MHRTMSQGTLSKVVPTRQFVDQLGTREVCREIVVQQAQDKISKHRNLLLSLEKLKPATLEKLMFQSHQNNVE